MIGRKGRLSVQGLRHSSPRGQVCLSTRGGGAVIGRNAFVDEGVVNGRSYGRRSFRADQDNLLVKEGSRGCHQKESCGTQLHTLPIATYKLEASSVTVLLSPLRPQEKEECVLPWKLKRVWCEVSIGAN